MLPKDYKALEARKMAQKAGESTCCSNQGWEFDSQHLYGYSQPSVTAVPEVMLQSPDLPKPEMHMIHIYTSRQNTSTYKVK